MHSGRFLRGLRSAAPALLVPVFCSAQGGTSSHAPARWPEEAGLLSANALLSGVAAGLVQSARGGSFADGFTRGAAGGVGVYAGKRIAAARWSGAGLLGRQVASVGSSVVWNAGAGRPSFEQVAMPVGPVRFYVRTSGPGPRVRARVDAVALASTAYAASRPELRWDARRSLSDGVMVFRAPEHELRLAGEDAWALAYPGTIILGAGAQHPENAVYIASHERVHIAQADQIYLALGRPLQDAAASRSGAARWLSRWVDVDVTVAAVTAAAWLAGTTPGARPWEVEATYLSKP